LAHVTEAAYSQTSENVGGGAVAPLYDRHATWVGMLIGGRETAANRPYQQGMAPGTDLRSAAIASVWYHGSAYSGSFDITDATYLGAFNASFGTADVVNSSFGYYDPGGSSGLTIISDAYAWQNSKTTYVTSAGNSGPGANTVGAPGAGYNTITVGALTKGSDPAKPYDSVASFSSRGPQDAAYYHYDDLTGWSLVTVPGVRAAVDIAAPGDQIISAYYGGVTGGNIGAASGTTDTNLYSASIAGTSFSSPLVAGGAALLASAAHVLPQLNANPDATQSTVIKSLLLTGADKTAGWSNGLGTVTVGSDTFLRTTQSLDWAVGAGRMNLDKTFDLQLSGTRDVPGTATGLLCTVDPLGWDYGMATRGSSNDYAISTPFDGMTQIDTTISWQRVREIDIYAEGYDLFETAQADLNLSLWSLDMTGPTPVFTDLVAESSSLYNTVEHLSFQVPASGFYGIRVSYLSNTFDNSLGDVWGNLDNPQEYGLAWSLTAIPETTSVVPLALLLGSSLGLRVRRRAGSRRACL
jgi:hypothetical protein